jgi:hypothetical protein
MIGWVRGFLVLELFNRSGSEGCSLIGWVRGFLVLELFNRSGSEGCSMIGWIPVIYDESRIISIVTEIYLSFREKTFLVHRIHHLA